MTRQRLVERMRRARSQRSGLTDAPGASAPGLGDITPSRAAADRIRKCPVCWTGGRARHALRHRGRWFGTPSARPFPVEARPRTMEQTTVMIYEPAAEEKTAIMTGRDQSLPRPVHHTSTRGAAAVMRLHAHSEAWSETAAIRSDVRNPRRKVDRSPRRGSTSKRSSRTFWLSDAQASAHIRWHESDRGIRARRNDGRNEGRQRREVNGAKRAEPNARGIRAKIDAAAEEQSTA